MGIRNWILRHRRPAAVESSTGAATAPVERKPLAPEQLADLEQAWAELRRAIKESGVTSFHVCTRDGSRWEQNANSVRLMAKTLSDLPEA